MGASQINHQSTPSSSMSSSKTTKVMESLGFSDPRRVSALPLRPSWPAEQVTHRWANVSASAKALMDTWNAWADRVEKAFQQMGDQIEDLEVSDDEYISFVRMIASHPARPTQQPLEKITQHDEGLLRNIPQWYLAQYLHSLWTAYADRLEKTYVSMTSVLGRCNLLAAPFETTSTRGQLHGILRSMLGPGRLFQGLVDTRAHDAEAVAETTLHGPSIARIDEMVSGMEHMSLSGAPAIHEEVVEGLVVWLKKMTIEAGIS